MSTELSAVIMIAATMITLSLGGILCAIYFELNRIAKALEKANTKPGGTK
jgi:hypothetical protein